MDNVPDKLISVYLEGELDQEQAEQLSRWVQASKDNARYIASLTALEHGLVKHARVQSNSDILAELQEAEDAAPRVATPQIHIDRYDPLTKHQIKTALSYVLEHAITPKRVAVVATAAALLLGVVLAIVLLSGPDADGPIAEVPDWPSGSTPGPQPPASPTLATITDASGAQWRSGDLPADLPVGTPLRESDRLTLTKGFAELTTGRGATVLLQAPCTIEMTRSDNAIRLHQGKLVGRCLTPDSKGFVVHAPGMDVVDLGTEFGVEADAALGSTVLVLDGEVRAQPTPESPRAFEPVVLTESQARRVEPESGRLEMIAVSEAPVFYERAPHPYVGAVLDSAPVAYWRFEGDTGRAVKNEIQPGRDDLEAHGSASFIGDGLIGKAAWLDNTDKQDGFFQTGHAMQSIDTKGDLSIELWFRIGQHFNQETGSGSLAEFGAIKGSKNHLVHIELQPIDAVPQWRPGSIRATYTDTTYEDGDIHGLFSRSPYAVKQWHHVVLNRSGPELQLYLDGVEVGRYPIQNEHDIEDAVFVIGRHLGLDRWLVQSKIDEVAVYDRALSHEEIKSHWLIYKNE
ncbi:MAG: hypothetical protein KTR15_02120 [Phycisphaeraceae bacterium]|nr:hypothetical protein [Phycisphaeraceae bacterium]